MTKQTKQVKRDEITEAKKKFLGTSSLKQIHYGDTFFFEDIILWGIRPMRLFADSIDNLLNENDDIEGSCLLLNELQQKLDDLIEHLERWDKEARKVKNVALRPIRQELLRLEGYLESVPPELQAAKEIFEILKPLAGVEKEKASDTEPSRKDSAEA